MGTATIRTCRQFSEAARCDPCVRTDLPDKRRARQESGPFAEAPYEKTWKINLSPFPTWKINLSPFPGQSEKPSKLSMLSSAALVSCTMLPPRNPITYVPADRADAIPVGESSKTTVRPGATPRNPIARS